jgi:hypothetical protein
MAMVLIPTIKAFMSLKIWTVGFFRLPFQKPVMKQLSKMALMLAMDKL